MNEKWLNLKSTVARKKVASFVSRVNDVVQFQISWKLTLNFLTPNLVTFRLKVYVQ